MRRHVRCWRKPTPHSKAHPSVNRLNLARQFCSTVTPASANAACQAGIPSTILKPAVVLLATKFACPAAARSAVSISSGVVSTPRELPGDHGPNGVP